MKIFFTGDIVSNPRPSLPQPSSVVEADALEKRLAKEFHEIGNFQLFNRLTI